MREVFWLWAAGMVAVVACGDADEVATEASTLRDVAAEKERLAGYRVGVGGEGYAARLDGGAVLDLEAGLAPAAAGGEGGAGEAEATPCYPRPGQLWCYERCGGAEVVDNCGNVHVCARCEEPHAECVGTVCLIRDLQ